MSRVIISKDCGNSPKNIFLQKMTIAFADRDIGYLLGGIVEDFRWERPGELVIQGKDDFIQVLKQLNRVKVEEVTILHALTHGKAGAVDGTQELSSGKSYAFCDIYEFSNAKGTKVKEIKSFLIEI